MVERVKCDILRLIGEVVRMNEDDFRKRVYEVRIEGEVIGETADQYMEQVFESWQLRNWMC